MSQKIHPDDLFKELMQKRLWNTEFAFEFTPELKTMLHKAMMYTSMYKVQLHEGSYENMITFARPFFISEVQVMVNILMGASPIEMGQTIEENLQWVKEYALPIRDAIRFMIEPIQKEVMGQVNAKIKLEAAVTKHKQKLIHI